MGSEAQEKKIGADLPSDQEKGADRQVTRGDYGNDTSSMDTGDDLLAHEESNKALAQKMHLLNNVRTRNHGFPPQVLPHEAEPYPI